MHRIHTMVSLYVLELIKFVRIKLNNFDDVNKDHHYATRHGNNLLYSIHMLEMYKANPYYVGITVYNKLSNNIRSICHNGKIIKYVKEFLLNRAVYTLEEYLQI